MNDRLLKALRCENEGRPPIWMMRQAGRFLPQYQEMRKTHSLMKLFRTPALAMEVTLLPIDILDVDAAILFSDILFIGEALGWKINFPDSGGIEITPPEKIVVHDVKETLGFVFETIELVKPKLSVPLIGFCGGPYTVARYLQRFDLLQPLTDLTIEYLRLQIQAGVDAIQIFDSWAGELSSEDFQKLSLPYLRQIVDALRPFPTILFCRGSCRYAQELASLQPHAISLDWEKDLSLMRQKIPSSIALQGNLDPDILRGPLPQLLTKTDHILTSMQGQKGFIFNLGHGVLPDTPIENALALIGRIKNS